MSIIEPMTKLQQERRLLYIETFLRLCIEDLKLPPSECMLVEKRREDQTLYWVVQKKR
jgi:hypothetical protein